MAMAMALPTTTGPSPSPSPSLSPHWRDNLVAGASAYLCSKLVLQPLDIAKTILQASAEVRGSYSNLAQCVVGVVRDGGIPKLATGLLASVAVSAPSSAVFVACYECSRNAMEMAAPSLHDFVPLLSAAVGNMAASVVRVPPEVIKQRVQAGIYRSRLL